MIPKKQQHQLSAPKAAEQSRMPWHAGAILDHPRTVACLVGRGPRIDVIHSVTHNVLAHAGKSGRRVASAFIATALAQESPAAASVQWRAVADQIRPKVPKLAAIMDAAETDVLAYISFPREHWAKLHSNNPHERVNGEIKRRTEVVGIFPNEEGITRLVGAILLKQNDEWTVQRSRYMTLESVATLSDDPLVSLPAVAR
jgi:putative transposase